MMDQGALQSTPNNPQVIIFPEGKSIFATTDTSKQLASILETDLDVQLLYNSIAPVKNVRAAVEIVIFLLNYFSIRNNLISIQNIMQELFTHYKYKEFIDNKLLDRYAIKIIDANTYSYKIGQEICFCNFRPSKTNNLSFIENTSSRINAICSAIKNNHNEIAEELIKEILKTADLNLSLFLRSNYPHYSENTETIAGLIILLEPKSQIHAFRILEKHYQKNFIVLLNFSNALLSESLFDEVIELLETKLANTNNETSAENIGACYYNLGLAYNNKINYQLAKKYYLAALEYLPNDQETILELIKIHIECYELEDADNYINILSSKDLKATLKMVSNLSSVSTKKLKVINKATLPKSLHSSILNLEYIAKFNEGRFSNNDKITAFEKLLKTCHNDTELLSTAIHTKQFNFAKEIIKKIPDEALFQSKTLWKFKTLLQLKSDYQAIIDKNNFQAAEAADLINISNTVLIANEEFSSVPEKVENALKYDPQNEETLEIGIAASLLNNNKEKAREYANQLTEEKQQEISANYSTDNKAENIEELIEQYDAKEIHAHYQRVKQQKLFEVSQKITNNQIISSWNVNKQIIKKDDVYSVGKYKGLNCFAKIAKEVEKKLDKNLIDSFTRAIEKGITYCKTNINGIKFLQNKAVEVKIDGEMRLFTNIFYKNSQEELLLNFDHYGNHSEVENFANNHKLVEALGNLTVL
ncbi:MAG: hypothetical protein LN546_05390 [Rickettsia endosymbiont of Ecitomorpha arachnoides]|nr:hypothetical protein [Rickettsia endosymbiont of Ecitomorpha arachnoides]